MHLQVPQVLPAIRLRLPHQVVCPGVHLDHRRPQTGQFRPQGVGRGQGSSAFQEVLLGFPQALPGSDHIRDELFGIPQQGALANGSKEVRRGAAGQQGGVGPAGFLSHLSESAVHPCRCATDQERYPENDDQENQGIPQKLGTDVLHPGSDQRDSRGLFLSRKRKLPPVGGRRRLPGLFRRRNRRNALRSRRGHLLRRRRRLRGRRDKVRKQFFQRAFQRIHLPSLIR